MRRPFAATASPACTSTDGRRGPDVSRIFVVVTTEAIRAQPAAAGPEGALAVVGTLSGMEQEARPSLARRALAVLVLAIAGWILLKIVIGVLAGVATIVVVVLAIVAVIWAMRTL